MRSFRPLGVAFILLAGASRPAGSQTAFRVKDIRPGTESSYPTGMAEVAGTVFFAAFTPQGTALWKTDGTNGGTALVKDIPPGIVSGGGVGVALGGRLLFPGLDANGVELWASDGTEAGTVLVKDIAPGPSSSSPSDFAVVGSRLFFSAQTDAGKELWASDGTEAGTVLVKDIEPGPGSSAPLYLTAVGGQLFFNAFTAAAGRELWRSDGTAAGTVQVADLHPGSEDSSPHDLVDLGGTLLFAASINLATSLLWRSDGTEAGTTLVGDVMFPTQLTRIGNSVWFRGQGAGTGGEVWKTDGTNAGTVLVADIEPGIGGSSPGPFVDVDGVVFFLATQFATGQELWRSDGTGPGTVLVKDVWPGGRDSRAFGLTRLPGTLLFSAEDGSGRELWKSDGTAAGTVVVSEVNPGSSSEPYALLAVGGAAFFPALDGSHGFELWRTDGTAGGTSLVKDINTAPGSPNINGLTDVGGRLLFWADDGSHGTEAWTSNGTEAGTIQLQDLFPGARGATYIFDTRDVAVLGGAAFFRANDQAHGDELWRSDGTLAGTRLVGDIWPGPGDSSPVSLAAAGPLVLFSAQSLPYFDRELWKTDGTQAGTALVRDIGEGLSNGSPSELTAVGGLTFMSARGSSGPFGGSSLGRELWASDGTAGGTRLVKDIRPGLADSFPRSLVAAGALLFFVADDGVHGRELWRSDGTEAGTFLVLDQVPGGPDGSYGQMVAAGGRLFFVSCEHFPSSVCSLWRSDGSAAGTVLLHAFSSINFGFLTPLGPDLLFMATEPATGTELWRSDGTVAGTIAISEAVAPGPTGLFPFMLRPAGGGVLMCAFGGLGSRLWWSDGTPSGTVSVADGPCPSFSGAGEFTPSGAFVYYAGDDQQGEGPALWALPLSDVTGLRVGDCTVLEGNAGTRTCQFAVSLAAPLPGDVTLTYATADGTATSPSDYLGVSSSLTIPAGATSGTISVTVNGDAVAEANEAFSLIVSNVTGANLVDGEAAGTILDDEAARFHALAPCRVADTRNPNGPSGGPALTGNRSRTFPVAGLCGIPPNARAVAVNLTVVNPERAGNLRLYPAGAPVPTASVINFAAGRTRANNAIAGLGTEGALTVRYDTVPGTLASSHFLFDVYGYFE